MKNSTAKIKAGGKDSQTLTENKNPLNLKNSAEVQPQKQSKNSPDFCAAGDISKKEKKEKTNKKHKKIVGKKKGRPSTHGLSNTPTYNSWRNAKQRCENPKNKQYKDYGGRGIECRITMLELVEAIGLRPKGTTLDRIDNDGHYEIGNIRWATPDQQAGNRRSGRPVEYYRQQAKAKIRQNAELWKETARWWYLSVKLLNEGTLYDSELVELEHFRLRSNLPRTSFDLNSPHDWAEPVTGIVTLPSLINPGNEVEIHCGPAGDLENLAAEARGILSTLCTIPLRYNSNEAHRNFATQFLPHYDSGPKFGMCFRAQDFGSKTHSPEQVLMALAARFFHIKNRNVRFMTMSNISYRLSEEDWGGLIEACLVIPDFQVAGPKGYGIEPWLIGELSELLEERIRVKAPTIIYAEDSFYLEPEIEGIIKRHYLTTPNNSKANSYDVG